MAAAGGLNSDDDGGLGGGRVGAVRRLAAIFLFFFYFWFFFRTGGITRPHGIIDYPVRLAHPHVKIMIFTDTWVQIGRTTARKNLVCSSEMKKSKLRN